MTSFGDKPNNKRTVMNMPTEIVSRVSPTTRVGSLNDLTLESYSRNVTNYVTSTSTNMSDYSPAMVRWIDVALELTGKDGDIVELGSAILRDATYIRSKGYRVKCSDGAKGFVDFLNSQGEPAHLFNVLYDEFEKSYNLVFANGVFPHFTPEEFLFVLNKVHKALKPHGILAISVKLGNGESFIGEKFKDYCYTHFWKEEDLLRLVEQNGYKLVLSTRNTGDYPSHNWLNLVLEKA